MFRSWKLGTVFGIGIYVHWTFLLLPLWIFADSLKNGQGLRFALTSGLLIFALAGCIILHELGHALMALYFGIPTRDIALYPVGGVARLERLPATPGQEICVALAGPAVNVVIAALLFVGCVYTIRLDPRLYLQTEVLNMQPIVKLLALNIGLVVFNMIPAFPMDGGRVFRAVLALWLGQLTATRIAATLGAVLAAGFVYVGMMEGSNPMFMLVGAVVFLLGQQELAMVRYLEAKRQHDMAAEALEDVSDLAASGIDPRFSGFIWDDQAQTWVLWRNGRPIHTYWPDAE